MSRGRPPGAGNRRDANEPAIVAALEAVGALVEAMDHPADLLVGFRGRWFVLEVKDGDKPPSARHLTAKQQRFHLLAGRYNMAVPIVESVDQALKAIGAVR